MSNLLEQRYSKLFWKRSLVFLALVSISLIPACARQQSVSADPNDKKVFVESTSENQQDLLGSELEGNQRNFFTLVSQADIHNLNSHHFYSELSALNENSKKELIR